MESSRRDLLNDMAEKRPILKNNQKTDHPSVGFTSKTGIAFPKSGFYFYCDSFLNSFFSIFLKHNLSILF